MQYQFLVFSTANLAPNGGATGVGTGQTNGNPQVGGSFTVGGDSGQTMVIDDTDPAPGDVILQDNTDRQQFLAQPITIGGTVFPAGSQVQGEFVLETDIPGVEIIGIRINPPGPGGLVTVAYAVTAPLPPGTVVTITGQRGIGDTPADDLICFAAGTLIDTETGARAVETLQVGDRVRTLDAGFQPVRWAGVSVVPGHGRFAPVRIAAGALGNTRDLYVSPQHRFWIDDWRAELLFGAPGVLVAAKHLIDGRSIRRAPRPVVTYHHFFLDTHRIVFAEGAAAESFYPGELGLSAVHGPARDELLALFPDMPGGKMAGRELKAVEGQLLSA